MVITKTNMKLLARTDLVEKIVICSFVIVRRITLCLSDYIFYLKLFYNS